MKDQIYFGHADFALGRRRGKSVILDNVRRTVFLAQTDDHSQPIGAFDTCELQSCILNQLSHFWFHDDEKVMFLYSSEESQLFTKRSFDP